MAHNIEIQSNGTASMAFRAAGGTPWHSLGNALPDGMTAEMAQQDGTYGMNYEVRLQEAFADLDGVKTSIPKSHAVVRYFDGIARDVLSTVGDWFSAVQPAQLAMWADKLAGVSDGRAMLETCGVLDGGRKIWFLMSYGDFLVPGDASPIKKYLLLTTGYDGTTKCTIRTVAERVVCHNTMDVALREGGTSIKRKNTKNNVVELDNAVNALTECDNYFQAFEQMVDKLTRTPFSPDQFSRLVAILMPAKDEANVPTRTTNRRDELNSMLQTTPGAQPGTAWGAWNAITDYVSHNMGTRGVDQTDGTALAERRAVQSMTIGHDFQQKALDLILAATTENYGSLVLNQIARDSSSATPLLDSILAR